jgi:hypothetical protein
MIISMAVNLTNDLVVGCGRKYRIEGWFDGQFEIRWVTLIFRITTNPGMRVALLVISFGESGQ